MSRVESLTLELEGVRAELQQVKSENRRLRESCPQWAQQVDSEVENSRLKELYEQALKDIQGKESQLKESKSQIDDLNGTLTEKERGITEAEEERRKAQAASLEATKEWEQLRQENRQLQTETQVAEEKAELLRYRELENEQAKWEQLEWLLMKQLDSQQSTETRPEVSLPRSQVIDDVTSARDNTTPQEVITSKGSEASKEENHQHLVSSQAGEVILFPIRSLPLGSSLEVMEMQTRRPGKNG